MTTLKKKWLVPISLLLVLIASLVYCVNAMLGYPASTTTASPSGRYTIENVRVGRIFMLGGMAYLRVVDSKDPGKVYRTPLYDTQSLDMRTFEDDAEVGITWIAFEKKDKVFIISMPQWEENWLNIFISNTPYEILEN
ncbi:hypothetical protein [Pseudomonas koreensis]|uniref:hypothetical protein n=1 Tax=Pseudomonas koreensis TaxID=198620 RepID=UPI001244F816|nr:hypothetical protein [Pseudomonas koreensis]KAB0512667.1 hypothetical protein F7R05_16560 [Pseudomonas koreensis]NNA61863.1 hypothetical protein [Pseudomonas koreensis]